MRSLVARWRNITSKSHFLWFKDGNALWVTTNCKDLYFIIGSNVKTCLKQVKGAR